MSMRSDMYDMELPTTQGGRSLLLRRCLGIAWRSGAFQLSGSELLRTEFAPVQCERTRTKGGGPARSSPSEEMRRLANSLTVSSCSGAGTMTGRCLM
eukprot:s1250_g3.t1